MVNKTFKDKICSTFDKDTVQWISKQLSNFEQTLDNQFDNKYPLKVHFIACKDLFGGPPNNSEKIQINYLKIKQAILEQTITP